MQKTVKKIIWLVDPFEEPRTLRASARWVRALAERLKAPILPVHVLAGGAAGFAPEIHAAWLMQFVVDTEDRLIQLVRGLAIPHLLKPHVISEVYRSRSEAVAGFLEFAAEQESGLIVVSRTGEGGRIGGFAETLLLKSAIPVLVVPSRPVSRAKAAAPARAKKLLVALDLSEVDGVVAREVFSQALDWAAKLKASLHLFHVLPIPQTIAYGPGAFDLGASAAAAAYWNEEAASARRRQLERLARQAKKRGVACTIELESRSLRAADAILKAQKRSKADWIVMAGRTGRWGTLVLGSVTRMVAREAPCPVWIIHLARSTADEQQRSRRAA